MPSNHSAYEGVSATVLPSAPATDMDRAVGHLNSLLRGEIAAAETYRMAIDKISQSEYSASVVRLREIQEEHGRAAQALRDRIRELNGEPSDASGPWGVWAKIVQGVADLMGSTSGLRSLKEGEDHGLRDYQDALDNVDTTSRQLIQNQFIPAQERHIGLLDQLISLPTDA